MTEILYLDHVLVAITFNSFPEVIAVSPHRGEFAQVVVCAPDVHILVLWAAHYERVVMATRKKDCVKIWMDEKTLQVGESQKD